jgi:hypothetical protein
VAVAEVSGDLLARAMPGEVEERSWLHREGFVFHPGPRGRVWVCSADGHLPGIDGVCSYCGGEA